MAATERASRWVRWLAPLLRSLGLLAAGGAAGGAHAAELPADNAEAMLHVYDGGGVKATGPALLVRKSLADKVSLSALYYVDMVSNASIDVVTTASPYKERRTALDLGVDYVYRDAKVTLSTSSSTEPDYKAKGLSLDVAQEVFGGMTTVNLGFSRGHDQVGKRGDAGFFDTATHWRYRFGVTQVLTPSWLASLNWEAVADDGYLGSPYRAAIVFGTTVPERNPRTRSSRALKAGVQGEVGARTALRAEYRVFWDTWDIHAKTFELGASRAFGPAWMGDAFVRAYTQTSALFYSNSATSETAYVSRNRQLSSYRSTGLGAKASYTAMQAPGRYEVKLNGAWEHVQFRFKDFTDLRTGKLYSYDADVLQLYVTATF